MLGRSLLQTPIMFFGIFVSIIGPYHQIELIYILTGRRLHSQNWQKYTKQKYKITRTRRKSCQNDTRNVARMLPCHMSWYWMIVLLILLSFAKKLISFKSQLDSCLLYLSCLFNGGHIKRHADGFQPGRHYLVIREFLLQ